MAISSRLTGEMGERERETRKWLIFGIDFAVHGFVFFSKVKKAWANSEIRNEEIKRKERG